MKFKPSEKKADSREQSGRDAQSLAQSACRFAGGSRTVYFGPEQAKHLPEAREAQLALLANEPEGLAISDPDFVGGEHRVYVPEPPTTVTKQTLPGQFGMIMDERKLLNPRSMLTEFKLTMRPALPSEYLTRWEIISKVFGVDTEYVGRPFASTNQLEIRQTFVPQDPETTIEACDIETFMEAAGFVKVPAEVIAVPEVQSVTFYRQHDGILVTDAHPRNFRLTPAGLIVPIDLVVSAIPLRVTKVLAEPDTAWTIDH